LNVACVWALVLIVPLLSLIGCAAPTLTPSATATLAPTATETPQPTASFTPTATRPAPTLTPTRAVDPVTLTVLYDNNAYDERLETAWGFACLVQGPERTVLFDTGGDAALLLRNMRALGLEPQAVDAVVISHAHGDHLDGLMGFLAQNAAVMVYVPQSFPRRVKDGVRNAGAILVEVDGPRRICDGVYSTGVLTDGVAEQALAVETARGLVVITGCAHPGVVDIARRAGALSEAEIYLILGGFHLGDANDRQVEEIAASFRTLGVQRIAPCHCTGERATRILAQAYGEDFVEAGVGRVIEIER
jgi:7,8-dihydropterin-6-yl-methyl-4-(beta-D-ribofuranosyl)aminobenzene 5'-phosphate synthase